MAVRIITNNSNISLQPNKGNVDLKAPNTTTVIGLDGGYYIPSVDADGDLSWTPTKEEMEQVDTVNIKGIPGEPGKKGDPGERGLQGEPGVYIGDAPGADDTVWIYPDGSADDLATKEYVDNAIANASIGGSEIDLSDYATKKYVDDAIKDIDIPEAPDLSKYALKSEIPSLDGYAKKSDIPDTSGFALKSDIPSLDGYAKTSDIPDVSKYQTEEQVKALINAAMATLVDAEGVEY